MHTNTYIFLYRDQLRFRLMAQYSCLIVFILAYKSDE